jgi:hypothetical protein
VDATTIDLTPGNADDLAHGFLFAPLVEQV